jgi:hypothetical protein
MRPESAARGRRRGWFEFRVRVAGGESWETALLLCVLASVLLASSFAALLADHDCSGEDCGVCANISFLSDIMRRISPGGAPLASAAALIPPEAHMPFPLDLSPFNGTLSPVETRVRLND